MIIVCLDQPKLMPVLSILFFILFSNSLFAQESTTFSCGSEEHRQKLLAEDENYKTISDSFEKYYQEKVKNPQSSTESMVVHTIPVVVHVIHDNAPLGSTANPSDAEIQNVIAESTQRFRHNHSGADTYTNPLYGADSEIEFCFAGTDPSGTYTNGIVRYNDSENTEGTYQEIGPRINQYAWDTNNYCNIFIVTDLTGGVAGVYMGGFDFTIYQSTSFWSGLVAHELGHYFSLRHTFQGGCATSAIPPELPDCTMDGDLVCDTPPKASPGFDSNVHSCASPGNSCTTDDDDTSANNPYRPVANGGIGDQVDMYANYMDYTGSCWDAFTEGQKTRMKANITTNRTTMTSNTVCTVAPILANDAGVTLIKHDQEGICDGNITITATLRNYGNNTITSADLLVQLNGVTAMTYAWTGSLASQEDTTFVILPQLALNVATENLTISSSMPNGATDSNTANDESFFKTMEYLGGSACETFENCETYNPSSAGGPGNLTTVTITNTFPTASAGTQVSLCITTEGDNNFSGETFNVTDENAVAIGQTSFGNDCGGPTQVCFTISNTSYNNWITDGVVSINFDPVSTSINPTLCNTNEACAKLFVIQTSQPVTPNFYSNKTSICAGEVVNFIDFSNPAPTTFNWSFTPNTVTFVNGTLASSANPSVQFNASGKYAVSLTASNANGGSTETKSDYIFVDLIGPEDFESVSQCGTSSNCGTTTCPLGLAWENETNGTDDDIDWRSDRGGTASDNTGPDVDHTTGNSNGYYLYLEASSCSNQTGHLVTAQCLKIPNNGTTELSFWYHMYGSNMGTLHVDIQPSGGSWVNDIATSISGDQGTTWQNWIIDLTSYAGQSVAIRIRGITGAGFRSDMAIDDIAINNTVVGLNDYYPDTDGDTYGDMNATPVQDSSPPPDHVADNTDCDDTNMNVYPGSTEVCDQIDNNCDTQIDEGFDMDSDNVADCVDNCPTISNSGQEDMDSDNYGNACDCDENNPNDVDMNIANNPIASDTYEANNSISSTGTIPMTNTVVFQANNYIDLKVSGGVGFVAEAGSDFTAKLGSCIPINPFSTSEDSENYWSELEDEKPELETKDKLNSEDQVQIYPNPFEEKTNIQIQINQSKLVHLSVYDPTGNLIVKILDQVQLEKGMYNFSFDGKNISNGLYHVVLRSDGKTIVRKMLMIK